MKTRFVMLRNLLVTALIIVIVICIMLFLPSCYNQKKATQQFSRAAVTYPKLPADYCAFYFPSKDSTIKGDSVLITDTLYMAGESIIDTIIDKDTVRITTTKTLPAKIINNTIHIRDTVYKENTAALKACEIDKSNLIQQLSDQTKRGDGYQKKSTTRGGIMWGLIILLLSIIGLNIYKHIKPIV